MKSRIRRISASVDTAISFGSSSNSANNTSSSLSSAGTVQTITTQSSDYQSSQNHSNQSSFLAGMSNSGKHSSQDSALGSTANNNSNDQSSLATTFNNSRSLDIQCVPESRIEKMRKLLSSPLSRKRNSSNCHHSHSHHSHHGHHSQIQSQHSASFSSQQPQHSHISASQSQPISRDANSSPSSSPSSSPALVSSVSLRTFGISLESLAHHQHPHHQQSAYEGQIEGEESYYRDPELVVVPHQKAAHILGQVCAGCLTSAPSNSSSMGSIHESSSSSAVHHRLEEGIPSSSSPGTSSSSTTSSTSSVHGQTSSSHYLIPFIVTRLCNYIEIKHGLTHEGLFRVSGSAKLVERLKKSFDETGDAPLEAEADLGSASTLLKQFLRELPHPLIPNGAQFLDVLRSLKNDHETCILALKSLVSQLPDENFFTLRYLIRFLHRIALRNEENRMSATNLGIVFAPNLFRVCVDTYQGLKDQSTANEVVHLLITEFTEIFGEGQCPVTATDLSRDDLSVDLSECPFGQDDEQSKHDDIIEEEACTRSLIDFRSEHTSDLDRKRRDYQSGSSKRSTIEEFYDVTDSHSQQRSQSVELGMDQFSNKTKIEPEVERSSSIKSNSGTSSSVLYGNRTHAEIIVTNSSDSVSTDDNTATTATSTGATVCSVLIGGSLGQRGRSLEPGSTHLRHFSSSGDEAQDRSTGSLPVRTARSGSCSSDCTENQNLRISLSDDEDGSLSRSIASACLTDDGEESDDTSSSILDGDTSGNEAGSSSSINETEPEIVKLGINDLVEELSIEPNAWRATISRPTMLDLESDSQSPSRNNSIRTRQNKRFSSIRRKLKQFETDFRQENGFAPSFEHKMASSFARPLMLELSTILNITTPSLRDIDLDVTDLAKTDYYREASPTRSTFNARQQANKRFPVNWRGPGITTNTAIGLVSGSYTGSNSNACGTDVPLTSASASCSGVGYELTNDEIFNTIFGRTADKHLEQLRETMVEIEQKLMERRLGTGRPESLDRMTVEEIQEEKLALQKALLRFEALYGRPSTKAERDIVRHVYDRYRAVKRKASNTKPDMKGQAGQIGSISASGSTNAISANELAPIIENVQMDFKSPTVTNKSSIMLEFEADKNCSPTNSSKKLQQNYHEMNQKELEKEFENSKQQKRNVRMVLRTFENDFQKRTGRRVEREDRCNMAAAYSAYKNIKAKLRLIEALLKKNQEAKQSAIEQPEN